MNPLGVDVMFVVETNRGHGVCIKFQNRDGTREVSIAADDSCGAFEHMERCDIRCFMSNLDVTMDVFRFDGVDASNANVATALAWLGE